MFNIKISCFVINLYIISYKQLKTYEKQEEVLIKCAPRFNQHFPKHLKSRELSKNFNFWTALSKN